MMQPNILYTAIAGFLMLAGLATIMLRRNMIKILLGISLVETGANLLIVVLGFIPGKTAPIVDDPSMLADATGLAVDAARFVDPVVQAIVLTAIVISVGVTSLMLAYAVRMYGGKRTLDVGGYASLKW